MSKKRKGRADHRDGPGLQHPESAPSLRVRSFQSNLWIYLALILATVAVYAQVRHFDFVNYDDPEYVDSLRVRQGMTLAGVRWAFTSGDAANWFPLTRLSHMLDVQFFGVDAGMHHVTNVLLHTLATALLFAFLYRATQARWPSAFVAFIFALHPLHVESVAWVAERKDVLNAFFWFLTLWSYVRYVERPRWTRYGLVLGAFSLGVLTKPMILTLPFVLLLIDFWLLRRVIPRMQLLIEKLPFLVISAAVAITTYLVQQNSRAVKTLNVFPLELRFQNALVSCATYFRETFWPTKLAVFYPYPAVIPVWKVALAGALIVTVSLMAIRLWRICPYLPVGWFWFLGTLTPVIGLVQVGAQARADRYMYIPMVGLLIMLSWGVADLMKQWPSAKAVGKALAVGACLLCIVATVVQVGYWRNSETLFAHTLKVTNGNYVAEHNLGLAIAETPGRLPDAIVHYRAALAIRPDSVEAHTDLGSGLAQMGRFKEAIEQYHTALELAPDCAICSGNLQVAQRQMADAALHKGVTLENSGRTQEAIKEFEAALEAAPNYAEAHNDLGVALGSLGQTDKAIEHFSAALRIKPDYLDARYNLQLAIEHKKSE